MDLVEYKFEAMSWPPPDNLKKAGTLLFGFDMDNQPFIVGYETKKGKEGWTATTLVHTMMSDFKAHPLTVYGKDTERLIKAWAHIPLTEDVLGTIRAKNQGKK